MKWGGCVSKTTCEKPGGGMAAQEMAACERCDAEVVHTDAESTIFKQRTQSWLCTKQHYSSSN